MLTYIHEEDIKNEKQNVVSFFSLAYGRAKCNCCTIVCFSFQTFISNWSKIFLVIVDSVFNAVKLCFLVIGQLNFM